MAGFDFSHWKGTKDLKPGKVHKSIEATKSVITTDFQGPYPVCDALQPKVGATISGFPEDHKITSVKLTELDGDAGRLDITLEAMLSDGDVSTEPLGEPTYEIEWAELQKPLETHIKCGTLNPDRAFYKDGVKVEEGSGDRVGKQRTWEDWQQLTEVGDDDADYQPVNVKGDAAMSLEDYKFLKESGQDSYVVYQPIVKRNSIHLAKPDDVGSASGKLQDPPSEANFSRVSGFEWLGGPDRCTKQGRTYTRATEWHGAEHWDDITYDPA